MKKLRLLLILLSMACMVDVMGQKAVSQKEEAIKRAYEQGLIKNKLDLNYWDSVLQLTRTHKSTLYEFHTLVQIGKLHYIQREFQKAEPPLLQALEIGDRQGYKALLFLPLKLLERTYSTQYDRKKTLQTLYKGLKLAEELNNKREIMTFNSSLGLYYFSTQQIEKALKVHFLCLKLSKEMGDSVGVASALTDIGSDYIAIEDKKKAAFYYLECKKYLHASALDTLSLISLLTSVAAGHGNLQQYDSALIYINEALDKSIATNDLATLASTLTTRAGIYRSLHNTPAAVSDYKQAEKFSLSTNFTAQLPNIYSGLEILYENIGNHKEALKYHRKNDKLSDSLSNEEARTQSLEKEFAHQYEKKEDQYKLLAQDHQIQLLRLKQNRYLMFGLSVLMVAILIIVWLLRRQSRMKNEHQQLHLQRKLLLSQMNPHFLFNAMNSIDQLVGDKETQQARIYISEFAQLTRRLLESSVKENITLYEEKEILEAYLKMESLRFENAFSYEIRLDPVVDPLKICIPHLMIQPFVENAIWHGLLPKQGEKNLRIEIKQHSKDTLCCTIEDNGIGRTEAEKKNSPHRKKSLAMDFVKQRIALIRKTLRVSGALLISDQKDEQGNVRGTKVELILPILSLDYA